MARTKSPAAAQSTATIGFEAKLWLTADTAPRESANRNYAATWPDFRGAKDHRGDISIYGQDKWARRQRPFGLATRARRVRLRRQQPKQSNATNLN